VLSNRYLFAGANPVSYADDGHCLAGKDTTVQQVDDYNVYVEQVWVDDPTHYGGGYHYPHVVQEPVYKTKTECVHTGLVGQFVDYANGNDVERKVEDPSYHNSFSAAEAVGARNGPNAIKGVTAAATLIATFSGAGVPLLAIAAVSTVGSLAATAIDRAPCRGERLVSSLLTSVATLGIGQSLTLVPRFAGEQLGVAQGVNWASRAFAAVEPFSSFVSISTKC